MTGIIPPFLLERLTSHTSEAVSDGARRTLTVDGALRTRRPLLVAPAADVRPGLAATAAGPDRTVSDAENTERLPGRTVREEGAPATGEAAADEAYDALGLTWTLLHDAFGRDSLDGAGGPLLATVHYGERYDNAFWDGERMVFGDGDGEVFRSFTSAIDVVGHELGHGVIQTTVDLAYQGQSGALNESIADVIGSLVKQHARGQTAAEADWLVGEGIFTDQVQGTALRSLKAPGTAYDDDVLGKDPQPAVWADYVETTSDNGGVHINSGIPNHAFYLAATAIGGNAWDGAGRVWFDVLEQRAVEPTADFAAFARATIDAATARFSEGSAEATAVAGAWEQVGVEPAAAGGTPGDGAASGGGPDGTVRVERSGGILGRIETARVEPAALPDHERRRLEAILGSGSLAALADDDRPAPDGYAWRIEVTHRIDVTVGEHRLPADVRDLLRRILERGEGADGR